MDSQKEMKKAIKHAGKSMNEEIDKLSEVMVKNIANKKIKVQSSYEGKQHQRHWYLVAQKMLKKLMKEYTRVCGEGYK